MRLIKQEKRAACEAAQNQVNKSYNDLNTLYFILMIKSRIFEKRVGRKPHENLIELINLRTKETILNAIHK